MSLWGPIRVVERTGSTNADLLAGVRAGTAAPGAVLVALDQDAGRGRLDRRWYAAPGTSIALSAAVRPPTPPDTWALLPLLCGLAVARVVRGYGLDARLKWPNDVLVGGRKLCGILVEVGADPAGGLTAVAGIGVNVAQTRAELPGPQATSLALEGVNVGRIPVAAAVLHELGTVLESWHTAAPALDAYRTLCATIGSAVRVQVDAATTITGTAETVGDDGRLAVRADGAVRWFAVGDVVHIRGA